MRYCTLGLIMLLSTLARGQFTDLDYDEAFQKARESNLIFVVHATAEWCGPCKMMDRQTYTDERVKAFLTEHAVAVKVDVDEQPQRARELGIRAMPTVLVYKDGKEFDRVVGFQNADRMLGWLEGVKEGKTAAETRPELRIPERTDITKLVGTPGGDMSERMQRANQMVRDQKYEEATKEYVWLWENMLDHEPAMSGVRSSFMAVEIQRLVSRSEDALEVFSEIRDQTEQRLKADATWEDLSDWLVLNVKILGEDEPVLAWVDRNAEDDDGRASISRYLFIIQDMLMRHQRWQQLGMLIKDPTANIIRHHHFINTAGGNDPTIKRIVNQQIAGEAARTASVLIAADCVDEALAVLKKFEELRPEADVTEAFAALFAEYPALREEVAQRTRGRDDLPDTLKVAMEK